MNVLRTLPQRGLPTVGAWCFLDRFGPQRTVMRVDPHPHMGLQTVTWPLTGEVRHRDALGSDVVLRPGALNLMTSGRGISHSEYSLGEEESELDALQLWVALPNATRDGERGFERHEDLPTLELPATTGTDGVAVVVIGTLGGVASPATTHTPIVGAEVRLPAGSTVSIPLDPAWEHAVMVLQGDVAVAGAGDTPSAPPVNHLLYLGSDRTSLTLTSREGATLFLIGGEPFEDELVMWWNFVGRSHEEIDQAWHDWQDRTGRFGEVEGHGDVRIPAPPMPSVRLTPRGRRSPAPM
jgi:redox-sensitive bicupin YhaK (pirin superfamily)